MRPTLQLISLPPTTGFHGLAGLWMPSGGPLVLCRDLDRWPIETNAMLLNIFGYTISTLLWATNYFTI